MDSKVYELLNDQINKELYSAYLYLSFADYYADEGLDGYENWYLIQAAEERDHALIFRKYLLDNDCKVELKAIDQPDKTFKNHLEPLEAGLEHERYVTSLINDIYAAAKEVNDFRTMKFLDWFIDEQLEEEVNATDMVTKMKLFGSDAKSLLRARPGIPGPHVQHAFSACCGIDARRHHESVADRRCAGPFSWWPFPARTLWHSCSPKRVELVAMPPSHHLGAIGRDCRGKLALLFCKSGLVRQNKTGRRVRPDPISHGGA